MKKAILFIPILFIAVAMIVSCTTKTCNCYYSLDGERITESVEAEKYKKNCKDQSEAILDIPFIDSAGVEQFLPPTSTLVCQ